MTKAQCGLSADIFSGYCTGIGGPEDMALMVSTGVPPFTVLSSGGFPAYSTSTAPPFSNYEWFTPSICGTPYSIEDGNGCITSNIFQQPVTISENTYFEVPFVEQPDIGIFYDCLTGNADVRIQGLTITHFYGSSFEGYYDYVLTGPVNRSGNYGSLPNSPPAASYEGKLLVDLLPGSYSIQLSNSTSVLPFTCNSQIVDCSSGNTLFYSFSVPVMPVALCPSGLNITPQIALQGAMPTNGTLMNDNLRVDGLLPLTEPYSALGFTYTYPNSIGANMDPTILNTTGNDAVVDWVIVEVRDYSPPYELLGSLPALLQRDGDVVGLNGDQYVNFPDIAEGFYGLLVRHRNHLGIFQTTPEFLSSTPRNVSLRQNNYWIYGGVNARVTLNGVKCLWAGDTNFDGVVKYTGIDNDRDNILVAIGGMVPTNTVTGYFGADINMDGIVKYVGVQNDRDIILQNIGGTVPTNVRIEQVP